MTTSKTASLGALSASPGVAPNIIPDLTKAAQRFMGSLTFWRFISQMSFYSNSLGVANCFAVDHRPGIPAAGDLLLS
jgi:hypothetical protein